MLYKIKRWLKPTTILLIAGFAISLTSVLIGISAINSVNTNLFNNAEYRLFSCYCHIYFFGC